MSTQAKAGFFSSILGDDAYAQNNTIISTTPSKNLQTLALLQANVSPASIFQDKNDKSKENSKDNKIDENVTINIVSDNAILPATGPMGVSDGKDTLDSSLSDETSVYVVRKGDSISQIATMFDVSVDTILWANNMRKGDKLKEGDVLFILPISGLEHTVVKGQTLQSIAKLYKADINDIIQYNDITLNSPLAIGDKIIIPNAEKVETEIIKPKISNPVNSIKVGLKVLVGYFINPVPGYKRLSQGLHGNNGVDLAAPTGTPILASAAGTVLLARKGYNGGYGNMVIIKHPNGTQTLYGHQSKLATKTGAEVSQGEVIGYVGSTGHSTGPHLHFEVRGAANPAVNL